MYETNVLSPQKILKWDNEIKVRNANMLRVMSVNHSEYGDDGVKYDDMKEITKQYDTVPAIKVHLVNGTQNFLMLDTGAAVSVLARRTFDLAKQMGLKYKHVARQVKITTINGRALHYSGCVEIPFKIQSKTVNGTFFLTDKLNGNSLYQGILGADFFARYDTIIKLSEKKILIDGQDIDFYVGIDDPNVGMVNKSIRIVEKLQLNPEETRVVQVKGEIDMKNLHKLKFIQRNFGLNKIICDKRLISRDNRPHLRIRNESGYTITLNKRSVVGEIRVEKTELGDEKSEESGNMEGENKKIKKAKEDKVKSKQPIEKIKEQGVRGSTVQENNDNNKVEQRDVTLLEINSLNKELKLNDENQRVTIDREMKRLREQEFNLEDFKLGHMPNKMQEKFKNLLIDNKEIFSKSFDTLGCTDKIKPVINLRHDRPISQRPLPIPQKLKEKVKQELLKLEKAGIIEKSNSLYASPLVVVNKKEADKIRLVCDFRLLNNIAESDNYPMPKIFEIIHELSGSKVFAKVDLHSAFHQVLLPKEHRHLFAFISEFGIFEFNRLAFGFKNATNIFQRVMDNALQGLKEKKILPYVDDIIIGGSDLDDLYEKMKILFNRLKLNNLTLSAEKCMIGVPELTFLGFTVGEKILAPTKENEQKILNFPVPDSIRKIKRFLGMSNFYRSLIPKYAELAKPLCDLTRKGAKFRPKDPKFIENFNKLRAAFFNPPMIRQPNFNKMFYINTDASKIGIGAILMQKGDEETETLHPIAYFSRALNEAESKYCAIKLELLALHEGIAHFKNYVYGTKFILLSDHKPLENYKNKENPGNIITKWLLNLANYDFEFQHVKGEQNVLADYLSRDPIKKDMQNENNEESLMQNESENKSCKIKLKKGSASQTGKSTDRLPLGSREQRDGQLKEIVRIMQKQGICENADMGEGDMKVNVLDSEECIDLVSLENIVKEQNLDEKIFKLKKDIKEGRNIENIRRTDYFLDEQRDILIYISRQNKNPEDAFNRHKIVVPKKLQRHVIERAHRSHIGIQKTFNFIRKGFYWYGCYGDVKNFVNSCEVCAKVRGKNRKREFGSVPIPTKPLELISMDILGPVPQSVKGNKYILTILDHFSRYLRCYPLKEIAAEEVATALSDYISIFGVPQKILTDNAKYFKATLLRRIYEIYGITPKFTSFYHPQGNGKSERINLGIKNALKAFQTQSREWEKYLSIHCNVYNGQKHSGTNFEPDLIMFGEKRNRLFNIQMEPTNMDHSLKTYVESRIEEVKRSHKIAYENLTEKQKIQNDRAFKKSVKSKIKVGQKVYIREGRMNFGKHTYIGPFTVVRKFSDQLFEVKELGSENDKILKINADRIFELEERKPHLTRNGQFRQIGGGVEIMHERENEQGIEFTFDAYKTKLSAHEIGSPIISIMQNEDQNIPEITLENKDEEGDMVAENNNNILDNKTNENDSKNAQKHDYNLRPRNQIHVA